jgi:GDPmannose 4,6-dehydratase
MIYSKTALIFGISGQDGGYLAKFLLSKKYLVHGVSRDIESSNFSSLRALKIFDQVVLHSASLTDFYTTLKVIEKVRPDEIYNLSGQSSVGLSFVQPIEAIESITIGVTNILESLKFLKSTARFYNASSSECFGDTNNKPANENTPFHPKSPYAVAKVAAHWQVVNYREGYKMFACSGILFNHESPLRPPRFVTRKIISTVVRISLGSHERLTLGSLSIYRDWGWAPDYVEAMWLMLQQTMPDDYVIATGQSYSLQDFVRLSFSEVGLNWKDYVDFDSKLCRPSEIKYSCGDITKASIKLGWMTDNTLPSIIKKMIAAEKTLQCQ